MVFPQTEFTYSSGGESFVQVLFFTFIEKKSYYVSVDKNRDVKKRKN
jgi:hypothetical protein